MNILHVIDTTGPGGAETLFVEMNKRLKQEGHNCYALLRGPGWVYEQLKAADIETHLRNCKGSFNVSFVWFMVQFIRRHKIDVIQSHLLGSNVYTALAGLLTSTPVIGTFHGTVDVAQNERFLRVKFALINRLASIVCVSELLRENLLSRTPIDSKKITLIKNGVDCQKFSPTKNDSLRAEHNLPSDAFIVGALGNLRPAKDYPTAIRAMAEVVARDPSIYLLIAGDIKHRLYAELTALVHELGLEQNVRFAGFCDRPDRFLTGIDLYLLTSTTEGHPFSVIQALASGVPVLATRCGVETMFSEDGGAVLVDVASPAQIADKILYLKNSPSVRSELGASGRSNALKNYDFKTTIDRYTELYRTALRSVF